MTETDISFANLPQAVQDGFNASKYGTPAEGETSGWALTGKVDKLERKDVMQPTTDGNVIVVYVIGVRGTTADGTVTTMDLYFSVEGILVNEVAGTTDSGYEDQLPQQPAADIGQYLQTNIVVRSQPMSSGEDMMHHMPKWTSSSLGGSPLPISSMSMSL